MHDTTIADVSVVIPCYKCADTIARAVASIAAQTLRPGEVILVEDFGGDGTLEVLYELQSRYPDDWIQVIALTKNGGPGEARNAGWATARQTYVAFLDADDAWHPQKIEIQYCWMTAHPDVVLTGHDCLQCVADEDPSTSSFALDAIPSRRISKGRLLLNNHFPTCSVMLRRTIPQRFAAGKYHSEDYLLWLQIVCAGQPAIKIDVPLVYQFKAPYGEGGLSAQLWKMHKGEVDTYLRIRESGSVSFGLYGCLLGWSWLRFVRRLVLSRFLA